MRDTWYPMEEYSEYGEDMPSRNYFFFRFDEEITLGRLNFPELLRNLKRKHFAEFGSYTLGEPMFATAGWVKLYKEK